jgi:hypothetical protein
MFSSPTNGERGTDDFQHGSNKEMGQLLGSPIVKGTVQHGGIVCFIINKLYEMILIYFPLPRYYTLLSLSPTIPLLTLHYLRRRGICSMKGED